MEKLNMISGKIKGIIFSVLTISVLTSSTIYVQAYTPDILVYYSTTVNLRLRSQPSTDAFSIRTVPRGTHVRVLYRGNGEWYRVYTGGTIGYMYAEFLEFATYRRPGMPAYAAGSVTVMDANTGEVLYENNQHMRRYPASITKLMTALVAMDQVEHVYELVFFSPTAVAIPRNASNIRMRTGDFLSVNDALHGLLLASGNDVARGLAEHVSGNIADFVSLMNQKALEIGAVNTRFINPCGMPGRGQHTTSYDMALIMQEVSRNPVLRQIISTSEFRISPTPSNHEGRTLRNLNRLINPQAAEFNSKVVGGKTGFTSAAQNTIVTYSYVNGRAVIVSALHVRGRANLFEDTTYLLRFVADQTNQD